MPARTSAPRRGPASSRSRRLPHLLVLTALATIGALLTTIPPASAQAPSNDDVANAATVSTVPYTDTVVTTEATFVASDPTSCTGAATVWYQYTPSDDQTLVADTIGSDYDTLLTAYAGLPSDDTRIACSDDAVGTASRVVVDATAGTAYYFAVSTCCGAEPGDVGPGGTAVFNLDTTEPLAATVAVKAGRIVRDGVAEVTGTVTCDQPGYFYIYGTLQQRQGLNLVTAYLGAGTECSSTPTTWTAVAYSDTRRWLTRSATLVAEWYACNGLTCDVETVDTTIRLRRR